MRGVDVRMIHIPACISDRDDIWDSPWASQAVGDTVEEREKFVAGLEAATFELQGIAQVEFLRQLVNDKKADNKIRAAMDEFIHNSPLPHDSRLFARLRRRLAAIYAALALAIDYNILPFRKDQCQRDVRQCMNDAIDLLVRQEREAVASGTTSLSQDEIISDFQQRLRAAKFMELRAQKPEAQPRIPQEIEQADGFVKFSRAQKFRVMLCTRQFRIWYPNKAMRNRVCVALRENGIFRPGRQADTASRQIMIKPWPKKIPCYRLSLKALGVKLSDLAVR
jgi:hypothetical protein